MQTYSLAQADLTWRPIDGCPGEIAFLRHAHGKGATVRVRLPDGAAVPPHRLPGGEEIMVLQGALDIDGDRLGPGDYRYCPPGAVHRSRAVGPTELYLTLPGGLEFLNRAGDA